MIKIFFATIIFIFPNFSKPQGGQLDNSFGVGGKVITNVVNSDDYGYSTVIQPDGKIIVTGYSYNGPSSDANFTIVRYESDGTLDKTFGFRGKVTTDFDNSQDYMYPGSSAAIQSDGKILVSGYSYNGSNSNFAVARYKSDGVIDSSFGTTGKITTDFGSNSDYGNSVAIQKNGKIIVAGYASDGINSGFALVRYNSNGTLDNTFDTDGKVITNFGGSPVAVAIQSDNKIVVSGPFNNGVNWDFAVARYNSDGSLDGTFDLDGIVTTDFGDFDYPNFIAVQADEKIIVAGYSYNGINNDFALVRYNSDGTLDAGFGSAGKVKTDIDNSDDIGYSIIIQSDSKIIVAGGYSGSSGNSDFAIIRYNSNGTLDNSFGLGGKATVDFENDYDYGYSAAIQSDGNIIIAGYTSTTSGSDFAVVRVNADGNLDNSFGTGGKVNTDLGNSLDWINSSAIQTDGKILVTGYSYNGTFASLATVRYNIDGTLDTTFEIDGKVITNLGNPSYGNSVVVQLDDKIIVSGAYYNGSNNDFIIARYNLDGILDNTFTGGGYTTTDLTGFEDYANSVAIQSDGKIVASGYSAVSGSYDFSLVRYNSDGTLDLNFDTDGIVTTDFGNDDFAYSIAVQQDEKIVAAGYSYNGINYDYAVARYNSDGSLDNSFGSGGKIKTDFENSHDYGSSVIVQPDGKIIVVGYSDTGSPYDLTVVRYNSNGSLDNTFGIGGKATANLGVSYGQKNSAAIQQDGKIVVLWNSYNGSNSDFVIVRINSNGTLDNLFGTEGKVTIDFENTEDYGNSAVVQPDGKVVASGASYNGYSWDFAVARYNPLYPVINFSSKTLQFGNVKIDSSSTNNFFIRNSGTAPLVVDSITNKNNAFTVNPKNFTVAQGDSQVVTLTFTPLIATTYNDTLLIYNNASVGPDTLSLSGNGTSETSAIINLSTTALSFGEITVNNSLQRSFYVRNYGTADLQVTNVVSDDSAFVPLTTSFTVPPSDSQVVTVTFTPKEAKSYNAVLSLQYNASGSPSIVNLSGNGTINPLAIINLSTIAINFGEVTINIDLLRSFYIRNEGTANLQVTNISSSSNAFTVDSANFTVQAGDSQKVTVTFRPTEAISYNGTLSIEHNASGSPSSISLNGNGTISAVAIINLSTTAINFGEVIINTDLLRSFYIRNEGTANLLVTNISSNNNAFTVDSTNLTVSVGDSQKVTVAFRPTEALIYNGVLNIEHNATGSPSTISLSGNGKTNTIAIISLSRTTLSFGDIIVNNNLSKSFYVRNEGTANLQVTNISSENNAFTADTTNFTVTPGDSQNVIVTFKPTEAISYNAVLSIQHNTTGSPSTINLTGNGFIYPSTISLAVNQIFGNVENTGNFRIIGIPGNGSVSASMSGDYEYDWSVYWDNGNAQNYLEKSSDYTFAPGKAYWILSRNPLTINQQVNTVPINNVDYTYSIPLHRGWNLISTPFDRSTRWASIVTLNSLPVNKILYSWNGNWTNPTELKPNEGYYYNNDSTNLLTSLKVPYEPSGALGKRQTEYKYPIDVKKFLKLIIEKENQEEISQVFIGTDPASKNEYDEMDYFSPPSDFQKMGINLVRKELPEREKYFFIEQRPQIGEGQEYNVELKAIPNQTIVFAIDGIENFEKYNIYLLDERLKNIYNIKEKKKIEFKPVHQFNAFKLYIGTDEYIAEIKQKISPLSYELFQNYPNPFNPNTIIRFSLPETESVTLKIFNILGEVITILLDNEIYGAGNHELEFNGKELSSGVYIIGMETSKFKHKRKWF